MDDPRPDDAGAAAIVEVVPEALAGERLDRLVAFLLGCSRSEAAALVASGAVRLGRSVAVSGSRRVAAGDRVRIDRPHDAPDSLVPDPSVVVPILYCDDDVLVVDKPAGLVVHPGAGRTSGTLVHGLLALDPAIASVGAAHRPGIVHRLDAGTTGVLVVARTTLAYDALVDQLARREVHRRYQALVWGHPSSPVGLIDAPIGRSTQRRTAMSVHAAGREARTRYETVGVYDVPVAIAHLRCALETGRTHQIRVHLSAIGHPVVGDSRYGGKRPAFPAPRPMLHADEVTFTHPVTGDAVTVTAGLPADFTAALERLGARTNT